MKERPILFSAPMVLAIIAGTKTQTRRVVKIPPEIHEPGDNDATRIAWLPEHEGGPGFYGWMTDYADEGSVPLRCPYGQPGDRLYVKESIRRIGKPSDDDERLCESEYIADGTRTAAYCWPWENKALPSIHCPRSLSRITLEITGVRVERLRAISEADAIAEGVTPLWEPGCSGRLMEALGGFSFRPAASAYADLWESINGPGSWDANPWVWVVEFRRVRP